MKDKLSLIIKGFLIGTANIIPGLSGGTLMVFLGVFEDIINIISDFYKNIKKNIIFIAMLGIGVLLSFIFMTRAINFSLDNYRLPTILLFLGLIIGGLPKLVEPIKGKSNKFGNIIWFLITFAFVIILSFINTGLTEVSFIDMNILEYGLLFLAGVVASAAMVIPGLSGSLILLLLGYHQPILTVIEEITVFENVSTNLSVLVTFGLGILIGLFLIARVIKFLLKKYKVKTYFGIIGFVIASLISLFITGYNDGYIFSAGHIITAIALFIIGVVLTYVISKKASE